MPNLSYIETIMQLGYINEQYATPDIYVYNDRKGTLLNRIMILTPTFNILQQHVADLTKYSNIIIFFCIEEKQHLTKEIGISAKGVPDSESR